MTSLGRFITLEGGEGVGKSTQVKALAAALEERGIVALLTREPGGSLGAEAIRQLLLQGEDDRWNARAEALLFAAARADHVEKTIRPALEEGQWVLCDRFVDSSLAYQGAAGGLGVGAVRSINDFALAGLSPDRTLVLMLDDGRRRALERDGEDQDRIGARPSGYHRDVEAAFRALADSAPDRIRLINASGSPAEVTQRLLDAIADLLP